MIPPLPPEALGGLLLQLGINVTGVSLLMLCLYYPRHHDKALVTTAMMFNLAVFAVLTVLADHAPDDDDEGADAPPGDAAAASDPEIAA